METPDPPNVTPRKGLQNRWQLDTKNDIPRILKEVEDDILNLFKVGPYQL